MIRAIILAALLLAEPTQPPRVQMLCLHGTWCLPCVAAMDNPVVGYRQWLQRSGWRVTDGVDAHFRLVDIDQYSGTAAALNVKTVPHFALISRGKVVQEWTGYPGRAALVQAYLAESERQGAK